MARTYLPTLKAICIRLQRYITRYDFTITESLDSGDVTPYHNFKVALFTFVNTLLDESN